MVDKAVLTRRETLAAAAVTGIGTIAGCLGDADPDAIENGDDDGVEVDEDAVELFIQAGPDGTSFQAISAPFGQAVRSYSENPPIDATVSSSGGGVENVRVLFQGETDVATTDGASSYNAMNGNDPFSDPKPIKWLARAALGQRFYAVRADSDIEDIADLEGARVAPGPAGSGGYTQHEEIMETLGIEVDNASLEHSEGGSALRDGQVDARRPTFGCFRLPRMKWRRTEKSRRQPSQQPLTMSGLKDSKRTYSQSGSIPGGSSGTIWTTRSPTN